MPATFTMAPGVSTACTKARRAATPPSLTVRLVCPFGRGPTGYWMSTEAVRWSLGSAGRNSLLPSGPSSQTLQVRSRSGITGALPSSQASCVASKYSVADDSAWQSCHSIWSTVESAEAGEVAAAVTARAVAITPATASNRRTVVRNGLAE